ncbi:pseudouridine synthase [Zooshikella sp. RANM57]|uniref:pseudouridine synthase n=1 Tax=Zooshikella sp. RANM57 TaxID=3425863 RepID=UPI003D6E3E4C
MVVDKPSGLLAVPGRLPEHKDSISSRAQQLFPNALIVHRLDWETSGLMVLALDKTSHRNLSKQFHDRLVDKCYEAVVHGAIKEGHGKATWPLCVDWPNRPKQKVDYQQGKPALTHWHVIHKTQQYSNVELKPVTGRSHQLRVHMMMLGHPILGDSLYAPNEVQQLSERMLLHAKYLKFDHPIHARSMSFSSPVPF